MKLNLVLSIALLLGLAAVGGSEADFLDCTEEKFVPLSGVSGVSDVSDVSGVGFKVDDDSSGEQHRFRDFFRSVGCRLQKGASKVKEQAKKLGAELKMSAKKWGEKAKDLGSDIKTKFNDFKQRIAYDSAEEARRLLASVELIDPDVLKAEQRCGHGHILDALGNCRKLRK